ncbi:MAG: hypothetical protein IJW14_04425 [Oscillospiraceae bacterium]|nr:hypothetical protein [Oscillospiraceae bacterium]
MSEMEDKLNSVLSNPQMMQQIMAMAQSMNAQPAQTEPPPTPKNEGFPEIDMGMLKKLSGLAGQSSIDKDQQTLLKALGPYLSRERIKKLEKAMRAARMARMASTLIGSGALKF